MGNDPDLPVLQKDTLEAVLEILRHGTELDELPDSYRNEREAIRFAAERLQKKPADLGPIDVIAQHIFAADERQKRSWFPDSSFWRRVLGASAVVGALAALGSGICWHWSAHDQSLALHVVAGTKNANELRIAEELAKHLNEDSALFNEWAAALAVVVGVAAFIATLSVGVGGGIKWRK